MILRLSPRNGERASVRQRQDQDSQTRDVHPGAEADAAERGRQRVEFGQQEERDPESTDRSEKECRRGCGGRQAHISRREQPRGEGPVGKAEYRRGPLLGHQVGEGREESPQSRGLRLRFRVLRFWLRVLRRRLHRQFRGMYGRLRCLHGQVRRPCRLSGREPTHPLRRPMGMQSGHPAWQAGRATPALSRPMAAE